MSKSEAASRHASAPAARTRTGTRTLWLERLSPSSAAAKSGAHGSHPALETAVHQPPVHRVRRHEAHERRHAHRKTRSRCQRGVRGRTTARNVAATGIMASWPAISRFFDASSRMNLRPSGRRWDSLIWSASTGPGKSSSQNRSPAAFGNELTSPPHPDAAWQSSRHRGSRAIARDAVPGGNPVPGARSPRCSARAGAATAPRSPRHS